MDDVTRKKSLALTAGYPLTGMIIHAAHSSSGKSIYYGDLESHAPKVESPMELRESLRTNSRRKIITTKSGHSYPEAHRTRSR